MQAIILAAGTGTRLGELGKTIPKLFLDIDGEKIIDKIIKSLILADIKDITFITGLFTNEIKDYLALNYPSLMFNIINEYSMLVAPHNNIYSLYLAKDKLVKDDTIIIESDILFPKQLLRMLALDSRPNIVVGSPYLSFMTGTAFTCQDSVITNYYKEPLFIEDLYKTVNIYKLSKEFINNYFINKLSSYIASNDIMEYYEYPLFESGINKLSALILEASDWFEIDTPQDYELAKIKYASGEAKYNKLAKLYGGYWRFPEIIDCSYLDNPFFDLAKPINNINFSLSNLVSNYPAGESWQRLNISQLLNISKDYILVGNGASELIQALSKSISGKVYIEQPCFNEYLNKFKLSSDSETAKIQIVVNPNNPTNKLYTQTELIKTIESNDLVIVDETFLDFTADHDGITLLKDSILEKYPNLVVIKSLGKSFNLNGLKIGILATSNVKIYNKIKANLPAWNINGITDYFLQIFTNMQLKAAYELACEATRHECERVASELAINKDVIVRAQNTDFLTIDLLTVNSKEFCISMLNDYNIFMKDLSGKGLNAVRLAIKKPEINNFIIKCFIQYFNNKV